MFWRKGVGLIRTQEGTAASGCCACSIQPSDGFPPLPLSSCARVPQPPPVVGTHPLACSGPTPARSLALLQASTSANMLRGERALETWEQSIFPLSSHLNKWSASSLLSGSGLALPAIVPQVLFCIASGPGSLWWQQCWRDLWAWGLPLPPVQAVTMLWFLHLFNDYPAEA